MITLEQIKQNLTELRNKKAKQVTDTWINKTADRLFAKVTEETVLEELLSDSTYFLESTQLTINSVLADEAKKLEDKYKDYTPPKKNETQTITTDPPKFELPEEYKSILDSFKAEQNAKAMTARKDKIFEDVKLKVGENQRNALRKIVELQNFNETETDDVISERVMTSFTEFSKEFIGENVDPNKAQGSQSKDKDYGKTYKDIMDRHHIS